VEIMASMAAPAGSTAAAAPAGSAAAEAVCTAAVAATAAADTGNSPRIIQESAGTAGSKCCQPFSIVRQLLLAVAINPIPQPETARAESCLSGSAKTARPR